MTRFNIKNRRRNYFIKKEFQTKFILKFCILVVLTAVISAFVIYRFAGESVTTVFENSRIAIKPSTEFIMPGLVLSTLVSVALVGIATIIVVLFISHRIAGPLYKFEASLERIASGDLSFDVHFRRNDEVKRLAEVLNETTQDLSALLGKAKKEVLALSSAVGELKAATERVPGSPKDLKVAIEKLETVNTDLEKRLNKFKLRQDG